LQLAAIFATQCIVAHLILFGINQGPNIADNLALLTRRYMSFEYTFLHAFTLALQQPRHFVAAAIISDVNLTEPCSMR